MKCKKYECSEVCGMVMMLSDDVPGHNIIVDTKEMIRVCLKCEHKKSNECTQETRDNVLAFLKYNNGIHL